MLIVTLPPMHQMKKVIDMIFHPLVSAVRLNIGTDTGGILPYDVLSRIQGLCHNAEKILMIDVKGRQLRVTESSEPNYAGITVNHRFSVELPARVHLRNDPEIYDLVRVDGNKVWLDPVPEFVGKGQALNVIGHDLQIDGYLTKEDVLYLEAANALGIYDIFASFVEEKNDMQSIWDILPQARIKMKIESLPGIYFLRSIRGLRFKEIFPGCSLVAARDDLTQNLGNGNPEIIDVVDSIIKIDQDAIVASCLFNSLKRSSLINITDISDLRLMQIMGYHNFLLGDGVSHYRFEEAMENWKNYVLRFPF